MFSSSFFTLVEALGRTATFDLTVSCLHLVKGNALSVLGLILESWRKQHLAYYRVFKTLWAHLVGDQGCDWVNGD